MEWLNPVEWVAWFYGKYFQNHTWRGGIVVVTAFALTGFIIWMRAVDKYKEDHPFPKAEAVVVSPGIPPAATVPPPQSSPSTENKKHLKPRTPKTSASTPTQSVPTYTPEEQHMVAELAKKYEKEHPVPISPTEEARWINNQLISEGSTVRVAYVPAQASTPSAILNNVRVFGFGSKEIENQGTLEMHGGSVTDGKVGIENNGGKVYLDGTTVTGNDKNIVNNQKQKEEQPEVKPSPPQQ